jgi:S1-C subfamily serine protease
MSTNPADDHLVVASVAPDGPAIAAGVKEGDKITAINGIPVGTLKAPIAKTLLESGTIGVGMAVKLTIDRAGTPVEVALVSVRW